jgi:ATP/maltotriose-dependent transcriptional regulator MalT
VVATVRTGEPAPDAVSSWWRHEGAVRVDLEDLDREATGEVLDHALGGAVGRDTVQRLHRASGGNPLLLRELVLQAHEAGQLHDDSGTWQLRGEVPASPRLHDLLAERLDTLDRAARHTLDVLATCGPLGPAEITDGTDADGLEALERSGLVRTILDGHRLQLVLAHPLSGEVLRAGLTVLRRRSILLAAADRVEALGARRREDPRRLATWRLDAGGRPDPELLLQAARVARFAHDFVQVERLARVLREHSPSLPATVLLGEALYELGSFEESEAVLAAPVADASDPLLLVQRATLRTKNLQWGLCDWPGALEVVRAARAALGPEHALDLVAEEAAVRMFSGHPQEAIDLLAPLEPQTGRTKVLVAITLGPTLASVGRTAEGIEVAAAGYREHLALDDPLGLAHPGTHVVNQAYALVEAGRFADAEALASVGHGIAVDDHVPIAQIWFALVLARSMGTRGRYRESRQWAQEAVSTGRVHGFRGPLRLALSCVALADAVLGDAAAARSAAEEIETLPPFGFLLHDQAIGPAWAMWANGDPERARTLLVAEAGAAEATVNRGTAAWLWHDAARLGARGVASRLAALAAGSDSPLVPARAAHVAALEADDADSLTAAADAFEALDMALLAAEASYSASDAHRREGRPRPAAAAARRAEDLAAACEGVRTPGLFRPDSVVPLTAREREIATLASQGISGPEIAERLFVSSRTVNNHLQNAYAKLGVNKREQLAEAMRRGPA